MPKRCHLPCAQSKRSTGQIRSGAVQQLQHTLGRPAQQGAVRRGNDGAVEQCGVRRHGGQQLRVGAGGVGQAQRFKSRFLAAQQVAQWQAGGGGQNLQLCAI